MYIPPFVTNISQIDAIFLLFLVVIVFLILRILVVYKRLDKATPVYDQVVKRAERKAQEITYEAMKESREMLVNAELQSTKMIAKKRVDLKKIEDAYDKQLKDLTQETKQLLNNHSKDVEMRFLDLTQSLENTVSESIKRNEGRVDKEMQELSQNLKTSFENTSKSIRDEINTNINKEFAEARQIISVYRTERMKLVDSEIVSLVEKAAYLALSKKLNLSDHTDLLYKALEEAKSKGIFKS